MNLPQKDRLINNKFQSKICIIILYLYTNIHIILNKKLYLFSPKFILLDYT